jgi:hypothetical protein
MRLFIGSAAALSLSISVIVGCLAKVDAETGQDRGEAVHDHSDASGE